MNRKITAIAAALAISLTGSAFAADQSAPDWPDRPETFNETHETNKHSIGNVYQYLTTGTFKEKADAYNVLWKGSKDYVEGSSKGSNGFLIASPTYGAGEGKSTLTNHANIWVENDTGAYSVQGIIVSQGYGTVKNYGTICVSGGEGLSADKTVGIGVDGTKNKLTDKVVNYGNIFADNAHGIRIAESSIKDSIENHGTISVINGGRGLTIGEYGSEHTLINDADIFVSGEDSIGIFVDKGTQNSQITNSGNILAGDDGLAIKFDTDSKNKTIYNTLTLMGSSHVEGLVQLTASTTLNIDNLDNDETLKLSVTDNQDPNKSSTLKELNIKNSHITFANGGSGERLRFVDISFEGDSTFGVAEGSVVGIKGEISAEDGNANFEVSGLDQIFVNTEKASISEGTKITTHYTGPNVADAIAGGEIDTEDVFKDSIYGQFASDGNDSNNGTAGAEIHIDSGYIGDELAIKTDKEGNNEVVTVKKNQFSESNMALAKMNALAWRSELQTLTDRMSTLRTAPENAGLWLRYKGGEWDGDGINQQFNGYEIGADKMITQNFMAGIAFSYSYGDGDLDNGSADTDVYTGAAYFTYFNGGWFLDVMGKFGKVSTDFDLSYNGLNDSGDYSMAGFLAGVETGYRFSFSNFFVEPQVQLTYSYLGDQQTESDNRSIDFDSIKSVIGRVGFMSGYDFGDIGSAYLRASYYHDFDGDVDVKFSRNGGRPVSESDELDDNWGDVGVGANVRFGGTTLFFDVSRTYGGDIDLEWKASAGVRYMF